MHSQLHSPHRESSIVRGWFFDTFKFEQLVNKIIKLWFSLKVKDDELLLCKVKHLDAKFVSHVIFTATRFVERKMRKRENISVHDFVYKVCAVCEALFAVIPPDPGGDNPQESFYDHLTRKEQEWVLECFYELLEEESPIEISSKLWEINRPTINTNIGRRFGREYLPRYDRNLPNISRLIVRKFRSISSALFLVDLINDIECFDGFSKQVTYISYNSNDKRNENLSTCPLPLEVGIYYLGFIRIKRTLCRENPGNPLGYTDIIWHITDFRG